MCIAGPARGNRGNGFPGLCAIFPVIDPVAGGIGSFCPGKPDAAGRKGRCFFQVYLSRGRLGNADRLDAAVGSVLFGPAVVGAYPVGILNPALQRLFLRGTVRVLRLGAFNVSDHVPGFRAGFPIVDLIAGRT